MRLGLLAISCGVAVVLSSRCRSVATDTRPDSRPASREASPFPYFGQVAGSRVRVRGGPGDFHSEDHAARPGRRRPRGRQEGRLARGRGPGRSSALGRDEDGGQGVRAHDRPAPRVVARERPPDPRDAEHGRAAASARSRPASRCSSSRWRANGRSILMPLDHPGYIFHNLVKPAADQAASETAFKQKDDAGADGVDQAGRALLEGGEGARRGEGAAGALSRRRSRSTRPSARRTSSTATPTVCKSDARGSREGRRRTPSRRSASARRPRSTP